MDKKPSGSFYRHILRDAWDVTKRNPILWVFGFFASFLGNGGIYELLIQGTGRLGLRQDFGGYATVFGLLPSWREIWRAITSLDGYSLATIMFLVLGIVTLAAVAIWVVVASQGGLIAGIRDAGKDKKPEFGQLFNSGGEVFWPLLGLNILSRLATTVLFYLLLSVLILLLANGTMINSLLYLLAFLVLVPLTVIIGFIVMYAAAYVTLYRMRLIEAIESAVALFRTYWLVSLETAVILFALNVAVAFLLLLTLVSLGLGFFAVFGFLLSSTGIGPWVALIGGSVVGVGILVAAGAGLATYQFAVWTLLFVRLNQRGVGAMAKLVRMFNRLFGF
jgi:hypothetical protein